MEFTIIDEARPCTVEVEIDGDRVRLSAAAIREALGWELKPQGLCKGERCIPAGRAGEHGFEVGELADLLLRPLAIDLAERAACFGASSAERAAKLSSLEAPDFELPDLSGKMHRLSEQRGKKVLLVAYASW